jgi:hypothetical protein
MKLINYNPYFILINKQIINYREICGHISLLISDKSISEYPVPLNEISRLYHCRS